MESITRPRNTSHHTHNKLKHPITTAKIWTEASTSSNKPREVAVVYYLSRNGNLDHPHFIQVPLSSPDGLYLRDVLNCLISLRGKGMAASYSWSSKRSYKNGFVWHDLSDDDFIYPAHGQDYVLKGSEKSSSPDSGQVDFPAVKHRRNQSCSATEYKVYTGVCSAGTAAATQTDEKRRRRRAVINEEVENQSSELSREEMSPPPSDDSSPETLESVMKADGLIILRSGTENLKLKSDPMVGNKGKANVLMQLITCGSISARDRGPGGNPGFSVISHYKSRLVPRGGGVRDENADVLSEKQVVTEDKEYFSGSLVKTKKEKFAAIKRSNSYTGVD